MKRPTLRTLSLFAVAIVFANFAYADCFSGITRERGGVYGTGALVLSCQHGFEEPANAVYAVQEANGNVEILGTIDAATKLAMPDGDPIPASRFGLLLNKQAYVTAKVQAATATQPQKVLEITVTLLDSSAMDASQALRYGLLETMPVSSFRILYRKFVNPDNPSESLYVSDLIPEAATYRPKGDDWRLHGHGPKGWILLQVEIGEPHFRNTNFLTSLGMVDAETLWQNTIVTALDKAWDKDEKRKILRASLKSRR